MSELPGGTVTLLFADLEASTQRLQQLGPRYAELLARERNVLRESFASFAGQQVDAYGDAFLAVFRRSKDAAAAAVAAQRALDQEEWLDGKPVRVRMALHTTEPVVDDAGYVGLGVHRGARVCAAGHGGQVLLSAITRELIEDDLPAGTSLRDLGKVRLKDLPRSEHIFQLAIEGLPEEFPPLRTSEPLKAHESAERERAVTRQLMISVAKLEQAKPVCVLRFISGPAPGLNSIEVDALPFVLGRDQACDAVIDDELVSRRHAELRQADGGELELVDLCSANGTLIDGRRIEGAISLAEGQRLCFGRSEFIVELPASAEKEAAVT
jgi:class 3 adenylate cyclase